MPLLKGPNAQDPYALVLLQVQQQVRLLRLIGVKQVTGDAGVRGFVVGVARLARGNGGKVENAGVIEHGGRIDLGGR